MCMSKDFVWNSQKVIPILANVRVNYMSSKAVLLVYTPMKNNKLIYNYNMTLILDDFRQPYLVMDTPLFLNLASSHLPCYEFN